MVLHFDKSKVYSQNTWANTAFTDEVGSQGRKGSCEQKDEPNLKQFGSSLGGVLRIIVYVERENAAFTGLRKSVDKGCIMMSERRARKTFSRSPQAELTILR